MKTILIGSVGSSRVVLENMVRIGFPINHVFSLDPSESSSVSGYFPLHQLAESYKIPYSIFNKINDSENVVLIEKIQPDYIFVIGLSQLVKTRITKLAKIGVIGFHPTPLPKMRGRAAIVWQILLGIRKTKCTMFFIDEGVDSGDIIDQEEYCISENDYASDVLRKLSKSLDILSKRVLTNIMDNSYLKNKQNNLEATYLLKRTPEDGKIDWHIPVLEIHTLIRATSHPYPGAFSLYDGKHKIVIWRAEVLPNDEYIGLLGQVAFTCNDSFSIVCNGGLLSVTEYDNPDKIKIIVGHKFK